MKILFGFTLFLALTAFNVCNAFANTFNSESFTLDNGMQVVVIPNHRVPVVTHMVWYKVGAADEPWGLSGMAHYLEHLMFKGTDTLGPGEFSKTVKTLGGNDNAFTGQNFTAYFQSIAVDHLEKVMRMEADRMINTNPPEEHFVSEKQVVLEERKQRTENDPRALFREQLRNTLYTNHPYGIPVVGWLHEIKTYEWHDVQEFYKQWYAPNNAILIVSGDITAEELKPLAEEIYGAIPSQEILPRERPQIPPSIGTSVVKLHHKDIRQSQLQKLYLAPAYKDNKQDSLALQVLEEVLAGGPSRRLYKSLVVDQKKATSIRLSYNGSALDYGSLSISATPAQGVALEELQSLIEDEIRRVIAEGISETELQDAIQSLQDEAVFARDSVSGPAMIFGYAITTGSTLDDLENWPDNIGQVTAQQVQDVVKKYLNSDTPWIRPPVVGYLMPQEGIEQ